MKKYFKFVVMLSMLTIVLAAFPQSAKAALPRIGFMEFKNETRYNYQELAQNVEDLLIMELVNTGKFDVIERSQMEKLLREQRQGATGIMDPAKVAEFGKINGIQYLVYARIASATKSNSNFALSGIGVAQSSVKVNLVVRVINTSTGSIALASMANGSVTLTKGSVSGVGSGGQDVSEQDIQTAAEKAARTIATDMASKAYKLN